MIRRLLTPLLQALARPILGGLGSIVCLHRVPPAGGLSSLPDNRALEMTGEDLRALLSWVRARELEVIPLDQVAGRLLHPRGGRFVCFTFDDGYRDNLTVALPLFREFQMPFTVNVTSGFVARTHQAWWYLYEQAGRSPAEFGAFAERVRQLPPGEQAVLIEPMIMGSGGTDLLMTWDEVRLLAADPLVTIGAHTVSHASLHSLTAEAALAEMAQSKAEIETQLGRPVRHLAYPFGGANAVGEREFALARECGFETAVTTRSGTLRSADGRRLHALPRLGVSGNYPVVDRFAKLESGLLDAVDALRQKRRPR